MFKYYKYIYKYRLCVCVCVRERDEDCKLVILTLKIFAVKITEAMHRVGHD